MNSDRMQTIFEDFVKDFKMQRSAKPPLLHKSPPGSSFKVYSTIDEQDIAVPFQTESHFTEFTRETNLV